MMKNSFNLKKDTRTHIVGELYETEKSYVESLDILVNVSCPCLYTCLSKVCMCVCLFMLWPLFSDPAQFTLLSRLFYKHICKRNQNKHCTNGFITYRSTCDHSSREK